MVSLAHSKEKLSFSAFCIAYLHSNFPSHCLHLGPSLKTLKPQCTERAALKQCSELIVISLWVGIVQARHLAYELILGQACPSYATSWKMQMPLHAWLANWQRLPGRGARKRVNRSSGLLYEYAVTRFWAGPSKSWICKSKHSLLWILRWFKNIAFIGNTRLCLPSLWYISSSLVGRWADIQASLRVFRSRLGCIMISSAANLINFCTFHHTVCSNATTCLMQYRHGWIYFLDPGGSWVG